MTTCILPDRDDYPDQEYPPEEMGEEWRTAPECSHDYCAQVAAWSREYAAERGYRESLAIARQDLDMPHATDAEVATATLLFLK